MPKITRRAFSLGLASTSALPFVPHAARATSEAGFVDLVAQPGQAQLAPAEYPQTDIWGYDGQVPGPVIRVPQGGRVRRRLINRLDQPTSVHWHGIRITNAMDGVPGMTQEAVAPGDTFDYDFTVPDAGTYWYHPHNRTWEQMARGLSGALIVTEAEGAPEVDLDQVLVMDDWRLQDDAQIAGGFGQMHDWAHAGRIGNWITVNGQGAFTQSVQHLARLRLRLINTANARVLDLETRGLQGWVVALDGMPLKTPTPLDRLVLAPAQRIDILADITADEGEEALILSRERDGSFAIAAFPVTGRARAIPRSDPAPLPPNSVALLGALDRARLTTLRMEGGAMGAMSGAMLKGRRMDLREMVSHGKVWAFNGMADMPDTPLISADRGETLRLSMINDTAWPHAMHLHGMHFHQIGADGTPGPLRDTLLVDRQSTAEIAFVADNPGDWLLHCHMLEHSAGGMMTWIRVT